MPTTLEKLSFAANRLTTGRYLFEFHTLYNLREYNMTLFLHQENFASFSEKCDEKSDAFTTNLSIKHEDIRSKRLEGKNRINITIYLPKNLETIYANSSKLYGRFPKCNLNASGIKNVYLQDNFLFAWNQPVFGVESVERLDLSNNLCTDISPLFTASLVRVKYLNLAKNMLGRALRLDNKCQIFQNQRNVEELDISGNQLVELPFCTFQNLLKMRILRLDNNQITNVSFGIRHMVNLSYVDFSDNRLTALSDETMTSLKLIFKKSKVLINLSYNKLQCTCQNLAFLAWMNEHKNHFVHIEQYICSNRNTQFDFREMEKSLLILRMNCINFDILNVTATAFITLFLCLALVLIIRKYIWHIRYFIHKTKQKHNFEIRLSGMDPEPLLMNKNLPNLNIQDLSEDSMNTLCDRKQSANQYFYDAFISYVGADRDFVFQKVKPLLESHNINVCIRDIHFELGNGKIENIMKAIGGSRRTICIVSKAYMRSRWRTYELNMAKMEGIKARDSLGFVHLVLMPDLFHGVCNTNIKDLIDRKYYLDYPPDGSALQEEFWKKLVNIIKSPYL
ncbi:toll-like receptor 4 [Saccostrea echinata]|uniref:toll-like receptor 4 n=1 Tax=Saccostrea echinata TaxID=191078 RepID=UPI002A82C819|nr:toll-like receptor 4 [Saccostrea echinata]